MVEQTKLPLGEACKRGFVLASTSPSVVALGVLTETASALLSVGLQIVLSLLIFRQLAHELERTLLPLLAPRLAAQLPSFPSVMDWLIPLIAAGMTSALIVLALRALWMGALVRRFSDRLRDPEKKSESPPVLALGGANFLRVLQVGFLFVPILCAGGLIGATVLGVSGVLALGSASQAIPRVILALLIALALTIAFLLNKGIALLFRATLVRAISTVQGPTEALTGALRLLGDRLGSFIAILLLFSVLQGMALSMMSLFGVSVQTLPSSVSTAAVLLTCLFLVSAITGSLIVAYLTTAEYGCYTAIDLDARGVLPRPPPPSARESEPMPVPDTEPMPSPDPELSSAEEDSDILDTRVVEDGPSHEQQEPIVETRLASDAGKAPEDSVAEGGIVETHLVHDGAAPELFDPDSVSITLADESTSELSSQEFEAIQEP